MLSSDNAEVGNILAVDDEPENLRVLARSLEASGYNVNIAEDGASALSIVEKDPPDLVLLDVKMPNMDGYEVCERMQQNDELREIPVIFISALNDVFDKVKAFSVGGVDYVTRPFLIPEVEARVEAHLRLKQMRMLIRKRYQELSKLEALKDELTQMVVHDMRSPLSSLIANLEFVKHSLMGQVDWQSIEDIDFALMGGGHLLRMVDDLLDIRQLEARTYSLDRKKCDLQTIARRAIRNVSTLLPSRHVRLLSSSPAVAACDENIIRRVIEHLVINGLKYTSSEGTLAINAWEQDARVYVTVSDEESNIPEEYRSDLFDRFGAMKARKDEKYHSTGVGLTFSKLAIEAHKGEVGVMDNDNEKGSIFWFYLPIE